MLCYTGDMDGERTEVQTAADRRWATEMSLRGGRMPAPVPGYEPLRLLGVGAYGEVWVAREENTGRLVAIKFYTHQGGLDWALLTREVEKLALLFADRYVVQLIGVGWNAEPPYCIMEYLEKGSLAERIAAGPLPVEEAVAVFRDVAAGLVHAHSKGVLHCDLKPANILLDQDGKPRLADFGQSRFSTEQFPALGTMYFMAPEQADLKAVPDLRWDVYALGALLYCMLTGKPPYQTEETNAAFEQLTDLSERLAYYRQTIEHSPPPMEHRRSRGVDKMLAGIIERCLAVEPEKRFPNVQAVLDALELRAARLARRPLMLLGAIGPALLLLVGAWFAWQSFSTALRQSTAALTAQALATNGFAARYVARTAANDLERRFQFVEQTAADESFRRKLQAALADPDFDRLLTKLSDPQASEEELKPLRAAFQEHPLRKALQAEFDALLPPAARPDREAEVASWFFCDAHGVSLVRVPEGRTIGRNFAWRSYFHGGPNDMPESRRPPAGRHLPDTSLSDVFCSQATSRWIVAVSTPVWAPTNDVQENEKKFLGVLAMTVEVGRFVELRGGDSQFAVLVNNRPGVNKGVILQHPLLDKLLETHPKLPDRFKNYRLADDDLPDTLERQEHYADPLAVDPQGRDYNRRWLARMEPVRVRGRDTGWIIIVQEDYEAAVHGVLKRLAEKLARYGIVALTVVILLMAGLWGTAERLSIRH